MGYSVDGSEIQRSPVEVGSLSHYLQGFSTIPGGDRRILPSTVWWFNLEPTPLKNMRVRQNGSTCVGKGENSKNL